MPVARYLCIFINVGLGGAARLNVGTAAGTVAAGDDSRLNSIVGVGQTWQNVASSRAFNTTYTNSTGKPIFVSVTGGKQSVGTFIQLMIGSVVLSASYKGAGDDAPVSGIIPDGAAYIVTAVGGVITNWAELS